MTNTHLGAQTLLIVQEYISALSLPTTHPLDDGFSIIGSLSDELDVNYPVKLPLDLTNKFICTLVSKADAEAMKLPISDPGPDNFARLDDADGGPDPTRFPGFEEAASPDEYPVLV
eukprot:CAMPEP_0194051210 /NCGR_PEP_ID=MMETSP0009_2-20130614/39207_1 /TAXON_ID=210454 /ORGANISM="Grammatophora oceanica, Strain CCMP 410" /LENGTH=115 /DNA_ID=CAMNT_0038698203 /DNA_START=18 /DNA_END=361 /DNA_ORIENTATION=+